MDHNKEAWKSALNKYLLSNTCRNVMLENTFRNKTALQFNVSYIPFNILIDPEGNIIAKNIAGDALQNKLDSIFSKNIKDKRHDKK